MMPIWALKALPYVGAVVLVGGAVWYIDHRGYERAEEYAKTEKLRDEKARLEQRSELVEQVGNVQAGLQDTVIQIDSRVGARLGRLDVEERTIVQPTIVKEIQREKRLSDPAAGITDGLRDAINTARSASRRPCPAGSNAAACFTLPEPEPVAGQLDSNPSD